MKNRLQNILTKARSQGCTVRELIYAPPANEQEVLAIEDVLKTKIPDDFRVILTNLSAQVRCTWFLPDDFILSDELKGIFCGDMDWGLHSLKELNDSKQGWVREVFPDPQDPYDKVWHNKFVFQAVGNGDFLSIDQSVENSGKIVYLSHDDGEGHGYIMANSFTELLDVWPRVGCVGAEDWQWLHFVESEMTGINPDCPKAILWRNIFGL